jgi:hypothetical protein
LTDAPTFDHGAPAWSANGRYLAYHRLPLGGDISSSEVWVMDLAACRRENSLPEFRVSSVGQ